jgi:hypothetical protein
MLVVICLTTTIIPATCGSAVGQTLGRWIKAYPPAAQQFPLL